jgi:hypothetical protein
MRSIRPLFIGSIALLSLFGSPLAVSASSAGHHGGYTCSGGSGAPNFNPAVIPPGSYESITVTGTCLIPGGEVDVEGNLSVEAGAVLVANFPGPPPGQTGPPEDDAILNVGGNVFVGQGATLLMGCAPSFGCQVTTTDRVGGNLRADGALGLLLHGDTIEGNLTIHGGGGQDYNCAPQGLFGVFGSPVYSTFEDGRVAGNLTVSGYQSCWLGLARAKVGGNVSYHDNALGDPDAIEILSNTIGGNLSCRGNQFVDASQTPPTFTLHNPWDSADLSPTGELFPRQPEPNTVDGKRHGQCVLASPTTAGGPPGPGPF